LNAAKLNLFQAQKFSECEVDNETKCDGIAVGPSTWFLSAGIILGLLAMGLIHRAENIVAARTAKSFSYYGGVKNRRLLLKSAAISGFISRTATKWGTENNA